MLIQKQEKQGWYIFTTVLLLCTLQTSLAFLLLFFVLDVTFLLLGIGISTPMLPMTLAHL